MAQGGLSPTHAEVGSRPLGPPGQGSLLAGCILA